MTRSSRHGHSLVAAWIAVSLWLPPSLGAQDPDPIPPARPRIGLVLSGGGARGAAHVGVLKVMEELRIPVHAVAANSMGALVGGVYCYGYSPAEMAEILTIMDWPLTLSDKSLRDDKDFRRKEDDRNFLIDWAIGFREWAFVLPKGVVQGHYAGNTLNLLAPDAYAIRDFDDLPIPYRAVATAIGTGEQVVLESGSLPRAMSASMAIPGVFAPVEIDGVELVDGMVVNNIPIDVCKAMGVDVIIAVDIGTPIKTPEEIITLLDVTGQMVSILMQKNVDEQVKLLTESDLLIRPDLGDISSTSFERTAEAIDIGETAARAMAPALSRFSVSEEEYAAFLRHQRRAPAALPIIDKIVIVNDSNLANEVIAAYMDTRPGERLDPKVLRRDLDRIHGREDFRRVTFEIERTASGETVLKVIAVAKDWGPHYIRFGLNIEDSFRGDGAYNFRVNYTMRTLNPLGAELRTDAQIGEDLGLRSEFYQPLDYGGTFFAAPYGELRSFPVDVYEDHQKIAEVDVLVGSVGFDLGMNLGNWAELRGGIVRSWGEIDFDINTTGATNTHFDDGAVRARLVVDTVDDANFPSRGVFSATEYLWAPQGLGTDDDYQSLDVTGTVAETWSDNTVLLSATFGTGIGSTLPAYRTNAAGGFLNLSGLKRAELRAQHSFVSRLIVYRKVSGDRIQTFGMPVYLGGSFEVGNVADDRDDLFDDMILAGSAFVGVDSPMGPVYFGYGLAEGGRDSLYLFIGQTFTPR